MLLERPSGISVFAALTQGLWQRYTRGAAAETEK